MKIFKHLLLFLLCFVSSIFLCMRFFWWYISSSNYIWIIIYNYTSILNYNTLFINDFNLSSNTGLLLIGNIFLYVPIGVYVKYISHTRNSVLFISFLIYCLLVEIIQYIFNLGSFDINDIIFNSFGFILGVLIYEKFNTKKRWKYM